MDGARPPEDEGPQAMGGAGDAVAAQEAEPLLPNMVTMKHEPSIYSVNLFQPELSRLGRGTYLTPPVLLAGILVTLNVTMQIVLSYIVGAHIIYQHEIFTNSLVSFGIGGPKAGPTPVDWVGNRLEVYGKSIEESVYGKEYTEDTCCNAAECSELGLACCDRTGALPHDSARPIFGKTKPTLEEDISPAPAPAMAPAAAPSGPPASLAEDNAARSFLALMKPGGGGKKAATESDSGPVFLKSRAICSSINGTTSCVPESFAFMDSWSDLDKDGDGLWTLEEARADEANLGCRLGMSVEEIFRSVSRGVVKDAKDTAHNSYATPSVPFSVEQRRAIPKMYFDWWRGLAAICIVPDPARCGELLSRGIFDAIIGAADTRSHRGGVVDLDSAADYCQRLLTKGGICEQTLPGNYMMYRSKLLEKCGVPTYTLGERQVNPHDARDVTRLIKVGYSNDKTFSMCSGATYTFFLCLVLFLWYTNLAGEAMAIIRVGDFLVNFPKAEAKASHHLPRWILNFLIRRGWIQRRSPRKRKVKTQRADLDTETPFTGKYSEEAEIDEEDDDTYTHHHRIESFSKAHIVSCWVMLGIRLWILLWMCRVGAIYLLYTKTYEDLLLNSVALGFIFDLPAFLYNFLVNDTVKQALEATSTAPYCSSLPTRGWKYYLINKSWWGICLIPCLVFIQVLYNRHANILPTSEALLCACHQEGENCAALQVFQRDWWDKYWEKFATVS